MKLTYNNITRKTSNTPGVDVLLPKWGDTDDLEWIDTTPLLDNYDYGDYFTHIAVALANRGYVRGTSLFGAPYDFRKGPSKTAISLLSKYIDFDFQFIYLKTKFISFE